MNNREIPQEDTPTYLGVKLDKKLTWNPHIKEAERKATRKLLLMKKLAGTKWGAHSKILNQMYAGVLLLLFLILLLLLLLLLLLVT